MPAGPVTYNAGGSEAAFSRCLDHLVARAPPRSWFAGRDRAKPSATEISVHWPSSLTSRLPIDRIAMVGDLVDPQGRFLVLEFLEIGRHGVDQVEIGPGEGLVGPFDGEDGPAGEDVLGKGLFQEVIAAHAVTAAGETVDVVVLGVRSQLGAMRVSKSPSAAQACANPPGIGRGEPTKLLVHAPCPPQVRPAVRP